MGSFPQWVQPSPIALDRFTLNTKSPCGLFVFFLHLGNVLLPIDNSMNLKEAIHGAITTRQEQRPLNPEQVEAVTALFRLAVYRQYKTDQEDRIQLLWVWFLEHSVANYNLEFNCFAYFYQQVIWQLGQEARKAINRIRYETGFNEGFSNGFCRTVQLRDVSIGKEQEQREKERQRGERRRAISRAKEPCITL